MKNKIIKNVLLCSLAVPCMFGLTACREKEISANEYTDLVYEAGKNYINKHNEYKTFGDMSTTFSNDTELVEKVEVTYKESASATETTTKEYDEVTTYKDSQTIDINRDETENGDISMKLTTTNKTTISGKRANAETSLLESYEKTTETTTVVTLLKEGTSYKFYENVKTVTKETGETAETNETKKVYTFESQEDYKEAIEYLIDKINNNQVYDMLSASEEFLIVNPDMYKDGDDFGMSYSYSGTYASESNDKMSKSTMSSSAEFKDNLPHKSSISMNGEGSDGSTTSVKQSITVNYSASAISAPEGSTDYTESNLNYSNITIQDLGI